MNRTIHTLFTIATLGVILFLSACAKKETELRATIKTNHGEIVVRLFEETTPKTVENFVGLADGTRLLAEGQDPKEATPFYDGLEFHRVIPDFMIQGGCPEGTGMGGPGYKFEDECFSEGEPITGLIETEKRGETVFNELLRPHLIEHKGNSPIEEVGALLAELQATRSSEPLLAKTAEEVKGWLGYEGDLHEKILLNEIAYGTICMANSGPNTNGSQFFIVTKKDGCPWLNGKHTVFGEVVSGMEIVEAIQKVDTAEQDRPKEDVKIETVRVARVAIES